MAMQDENTRAVARRIRDLRKSRGWSAQTLADQLLIAGHPELNRSQIASIESGRRSYITISDLHAFAAVLGTVPSSLLDPNECMHCHGAPPPGFTCNACSLTVTE